MVEDFPLAAPGVARAELVVVAPPLCGLVDRLGTGRRGREPGRDLDLTHAERGLDKDSARHPEPGQQRVASRPRAPDETEPRQEEGRDVDHRSLLGEPSDAVDRRLLGRGKANDGDIGPQADVVEVGQRQRADAVRDRDEVRRQQRPEGRGQDPIAVDDPHQRPVARGQVMPGMRLGDADPEVSEALAAEQDDVVRAAERRVGLAPVGDPGHVRRLGLRTVVLVEVPIGFVSVDRRTGSIRQDILCS